MNNDLSRQLVRLLRHEACANGLDISSDGYVDVDAILDLHALCNFSEDDVRRVVDRDSKGRFALRTQHRRLQIKATQGHSISLPALELTPITHESEARVVLHGTKSIHWQKIREQGLRRMNRQYIHFAQGEQVKSGFPPGCDLVITINLAAALRGGIKFYKSENEVILSHGNDNGVIAVKYFKRVHNRYSGDQIYP